MAILPPNSSAWNDVLKGASYDTPNDQQASTSHDMVGDASHALLQGQTSGSGSSTIFYFRARMGDDAPRTSVMLGIDVNRDDRFDVFVEANVRASSSASWFVALHKSDPTQDGISPSTTGWLNSSSNINIERPLSSTNSYIAVDAAGTDLDVNTKLDSWVTFAFTFADLNPFVKDALGIDTFTTSTPVTLSAFSSGGQVANGDIAGVNGASSSSWTSLGILTTNSMTGFASGSPSTPTIDAISTSDTTPTINGTWGGTNGGTDTLSVTIDGTTYTTSTSPALVISGTNWSLTTSALATGTYDITATVTRSGGGSATTTETSGLTVVASGDTTAPTLNSLSPSDDATNVAVGSDFVMTFSENVVAGPGSITLYSGSTIVEVFSLHTGQGSFGGTITLSGNTVTINPGVLLSTNTSYNIQVDPDAVLDPSGNAYAGISGTSLWNFTTASSLGNPSAPTVDVLITNSATPTVSGTWGGINGGTDSLSVTVGSTTYTTSNGLVVSGTTWSLLLPTLSEGTYEIAVTASRTGGGSTSDTTTNELVVDTTPPAISSFQMSDTGITGGTGTVSNGDTVTITLTSNELLNVTGTPTITLSDGATATYSGGSGTSSLTFTYVVGPTDAAAADLGVTSIGSGITDLAGNALSTTNLGTVGSDSAITGTLSVNCYRAGMRVLTAKGEVPVEDLKQGDLVLTAGNGFQPVKWIGTQRFSGRILGRRGAPVCFHAGSLGDGTPRTDLFVSPAHGMRVDGHLVAAALLLDDVTITQTATSDDVEYVHVDLGYHDCILVEGAWGESYWENAGNRAHFHNVESFHAQFPNHDAQTGSTCLPYINEGRHPELPRLRALLTPRLDPSQLSENADMHLLVDGKQQVLGRINDYQWQALIPAGTRSVQLVSRTVRPSMLGGSNDHRALGVRVHGLSVSDGSGGMRVIPLDHPALRSGFHGVERHRGQLWRWTDGNAAIPVTVLGDLVTPLVLTLSCQQLGRYRVEARPMHHAEADRSVSAVA